MVSMVPTSRQEMALSIEKRGVWLHWLRTIRYTQKRS